jgi:hypothetical protein
MGCRAGSEDCSGDRAKLKALSTDRTWHARPLHAAEVLTLATTASAQTVVRIGRVDLTFNWTFGGIYSELSIDVQDNHNVCTRPAHRRK